MKETPWSSIREQNSVDEEFLGIVGNGNPTDEGDWHERGPVTDQCHDRSGKPDKRSDKKLGQKSSKRRSFDARQLVCAFQDMKPLKSILRKCSDMQKPIQRVKFTTAFARHTKFRDRNPSLGYNCLGDPHQRSPNAPKFEDRSQEETEWQEQGAREAAWNLAKSYWNSRSKKEQQSSHLRRIGACLHQLLNLRNENLVSTQERQCTWSAKRTWVMLKWILWRIVQSYDSPNRQWRSANAWRGNGVCQRIVYIFDYESSRKHASSLIARKALRWTRILMWVDQRSKTTSFLKRDSDSLQHGELRSYCGSRLVKEFFLWFSSFNFNDTFETGESFFFIFFQLVFFTYSKWETREREDRTESDISPVQVSNSVDDISGKPDEDQANKIPKTNKKETTITRGDPLCSDDSEIPEWLQEFRENLVDDEIPLQGGSHASSSHELSLEPMSTRSEDLDKHSVNTHFLQDRNCEICERTKIRRAPCRRRIGRVVLRAENFGDLITADHKVLSDNCESRNNHRYAVVVQDLATRWIQSYPCKTKTSQETQKSLQKFSEPDRKPKVICTDNSLEFGKSCEDLSGNHCTSTPHRSETNGIAGRAVRRVKEGTSAVLLQSGLNESWWADSMECYTYLRNVTDLLSDGKTPCERRFRQPFKRTDYSIWFIGWVSP